MSCEMLSFKYEALISKESLISLSIKYLFFISYIILYPICTINRLFFVFFRDKSALGG